jgi:C_GCAxxG_C_C family probable redox protein
MDRGLVRMATGFHGGGGCHKSIVSTDPGELKHPEYMATDYKKSGMTNMGGQCGALSAGMMIIGYLYGRRTPEDDISCASELCWELQNRFEETLGSKQCSILKPFYVKTSDEAARNEPGTCGKVYATGAELAVEVILNAQDICPLCSKTDVPVS